MEATHQLEILQPIHSSTEKRTCLFGVLDNCVTQIGKRVLRSIILQPSCDLDFIKSTHKCIAELRENPILLASIEEHLRSFQHVDRLSQIAYSAKQVNARSMSKS